MSAKDWENIISPSSMGFMKDDFIERLGRIDYQQPSPRSGTQYGFCSSMKPKDLRSYDSCPECGKSLFARKQRKHKW